MAPGDELLGQASIRQCTLAARLTTAAQVVSRGRHVSLVSGERGVKRVRARQE
jgi:hypothetical protein